MPDGKPPGVPCVNLDDDYLCQLFGDPRRPQVCQRFDYDPELCGDNRQQALATLAAWEEAT
ncbi:hypothetical protein GCM10008094_16490 [Aidingimonas halophila]|nr:hypothetical protein GCM10008094_16490 [Aidingimonas halophila]